MARYALTPEGRNVPPDEILEALADGPKDVTELSEETGLTGQGLTGKLTAYLAMNYIRYDNVPDARLQRRGGDESSSDVLNAEADMSTYLFPK